VALLACELVAPPAARAECAHYVTSRTHSTSDLANIELLSLSGALPAPAVETSRKESNEPTPCQGGFCSGGPAVPPVPVSTVWQRGGQWALFEFPTPLSGTGSVMAPYHQATLRSLLNNPSIFHPPRTRDSLISR